MCLADVSSLIKETEMTSKGVEMVGDNSPGHRRSATEEFRISNRGWNRGARLGGNISVLINVSGLVCFIWIDDVDKN